MQQSIVDRYGEARLPRYTSYPTAPRFSGEFAPGLPESWLQAVGADAPVSAYLHVPFCQAMCWYCGCHTSVTRQRRPVDDYVDALLGEIELVARQRRSDFALGEIHFGGGTPTIIAPEQFVALMRAMQDRLGLAENANISIEIDPRSFTEAMAAAFAECGVTRASLGVQSFDPAVQRAINRIQSAEMTDDTVRMLRRNGIGSINFDLIYGLPEQDIASCLDTVEATVSMRPERISVFGYAHVPGFKKHQRMINEARLPDVGERARQAAAIEQALTDAGYEAIGLDHFALPEDELANAAREGRLHRNFQGYTTDACETLIGFGASAIGRLSGGYVQNIVASGQYEKQIAEGRLATAKLCPLTAEDRMRGEIIERLMCDFRVDVGAIAARHGFAAEPLLYGNKRLETLQQDGLVEIADGVLRVADGHRFLVRAAAAAFDAYLDQAQRKFSQAA